MAATRVQQDTFMDDSDDTCPLCVEEFDLSDKNFRPCPCGYQVCQFCYNNIKTNLNGLCPACRRPYDEKSIEWKIVSPEEFKADVALQARKKAAARQKEVERRQAESSSRKNLAGLRVVQKNLVYVVGLNPKIREEDLLQTLRGDQYFGQYGKIIKIVVSKAKEGSGGNQSIGVYVTFARKQDAASCIAAVDGSQNGDRVLRAQYGTTKYCSAYLRNEVCNNKGCMFLHETGEDNDSFSRQDLSSMNAVSTQRPAPTSGSSSSSNRVTQPPPPPALQPQPPAPQPTLQNASASSQVLAQHASKDESMSRSDSGDGGALPTTANWIKHPQVQQSRQSSQAASESTPSPETTNAKLLSVASDNITTTEPSRSAAEANTSSYFQDIAPHAVARKASISTEQAQAQTLFGLQRAVQTVIDSSFKWTLDRSLYDPATLNIIDNYPPLIDINGGAVRHAMKAQQELKRLKEDEEQRNMIQTMSTVDDDDNLASGSLQLGGEPETQDHQTDMLGRLTSGQRGASQQRVFGGSNGIGQPFDGQVAMANNFVDLTLSGRSLTPQQQQQISMLKSSNQQNDAILEQIQRGNSGHISQHQPQLSNPFQAQNQQLSALSGHTRQASRYTFANDSASASATVKPATSAQLMAQQSTMMPQQQSKSFMNQAQQPPVLHTNFYSSVQGPPPGLKSSGTPPISGGGMFGQGHGFASAMGGSLGLGGNNLGGKNSNDDLMRDFLRGRNGISNGLGSDVGKREFMFPSFLQKPVTTTTSPAPSLSNPLYSPQLGAYNGYQDQGHLKQKKKGKKHRHANTSSSGGGGIVDLADPSILQARVHHAGAGQGPYGGRQGQGPPELRAIERPLKSTAIFDNLIVTPAKILSSRSQAATPVSVPPGLSSALDFPPLASPQRPSGPPKTSNKLTSAVLPAVTPITSNLRNQSVLAITRSQAEPQDANDPVEEKHRNLSSDSTVSAATPVLDLNPVQSVPTTPECKDADLELKTRAQRTGRAQFTASGKETHEPKNVHGSSNPPGKRQHPGKLDISAAKDISQKDLEAMTTPTHETKPITPKKEYKSQLSSASEPTTPATTAPQISASPALRQGLPRTLRVVKTPKIEAPPKLADDATRASTPTAVVGRQLSRQPSITSINLPGTPVNELISDNASLTSASMSRPGSPPASMVGSAPLRQTTKSQQKKERQARAKQLEKSMKLDDLTTVTLDDEPVQAAIIGRKKKTKKSKLQVSTDSNIVSSEPSSPAPRDEKHQQSSRPSTTANALEGKRSSAEAKKTTKKETAKPAREEPESVESRESANERNEKSGKTQLTAALIFAELQKAGEIAVNAIELFRNVPGYNHRLDLTDSDLAELNVVPSVSNTQRNNLDQGKGVYVKTATNKYAVILPNRQVLRGFSRQEAERYLDLRQRALDANVATSFRSARYSIERWLDAEMPEHAAMDGEASRMQNASIGRDSLTPVDISQMMIDPFTHPYLQDQHVEMTDESAWDGNVSANVTTSQGLPTRQPTISVDEAEQALSMGRKETEVLEKKLNGLLKKNKKLLMTIH